MERLMSSLFEILENDHRTARGMLEQISEHVDEDPEGALLLLDEVRLLILAHAHAEARTLYPVLSSFKATADLSRMGFDEHTAIEVLLDQLVEGRHVDDAFKKTLEALLDLVDHHFDEEELHLFPRAARVLGRRRLSELADEYIAEKSRELFRLGDDQHADRLLGDNHQVILGID